MAWSQLPTAVKPLGHDRHLGLGIVEAFDEELDVDEN
jgi:hypothetical protein